MEGSNNKVAIEFTIKEAKILSQSIQHYNPPQDDEMIAIMLYARIVRRIEDIERKSKNETP